MSLRDNVSRSMSWPPCTQPHLVPYFYLGSERWHRWHAHQIFLHKPGIEHSEWKNVNGCEWWAKIYSHVTGTNVKCCTFIQRKQKAWNYWMWKLWLNQSLSGQDWWLQLWNRARGCQLYAVIPSKLIQCCFGYRNIGTLFKKGSSYLRSGNNQSGVVCLSIMLHPKKHVETLRHDSHGEKIPVHP